MKDLKPFRRDWSVKQKQLREMFQSGSEHPARELFLSQHQVLHSEGVSGTAEWSYADRIFSGLTAEQYRFIPGGEEHSLNWILWHISRIEDITMNILVAGKDQVYLQQGWKQRLESPFDHTGNAGLIDTVHSLSKALNPELLLAYRNGVGVRTREIVREVPVFEWGEKVRGERLERLVAEGAVLPQAEGLLSYWGKRRIFELFLMPPTRHLMSHLNQAHRIKRKILKSLAGT